MITISDTIIYNYKNINKPLDIEKTDLRLKNGEPCNHIGCLNHITHPCEGCGRIAGKTNKEYV